MLRRAFAAILATTLALVSIAAVSAADSPCGRWPAYSKVEPSASNIVLARVVEVQDGVATKAGVRDVLRGESPRRVRLGRLDPGKLKGRECEGPPPVLAEVGATLVIARDGLLPGRNGPVDTIAVVGGSRTPNPMGVERLTRQQIRQVDDARPWNAAPLDTGPPPPKSPLREQIIDFIRGSVYRAIRAVDRDIRVPWPERPPAPLPPGADPLELTVAPPAGVHRPTGGWFCNQARWTGRLEVVEGALVVVKGSPVVWPRGFSARVAGDVAELVAPDGSVVARAGERFSAGGGYGPASDAFLACTVAGRNYSPAS